MKDCSGTFEQQLESIETKIREIESRCSEMERIKVMYAKLEKSPFKEMLTFYTEHTAAECDQQWNEVNQLCKDVKATLEREIGK